MPAVPASPPAPTSVLVVGAGLAGAGTVTALRDQGFAGRITVLGAEDEEPYDRPPLSKELLTRTTPARLSDEIGTRLDAADDVRLATRATGLRLGSGAPVTVTTDDDALVADAVVLATGAHAVLPAGWSGALTLHTADDAARLRAALAPGRRLVVVGAGWI
ncbi:MAG: FAD-dependent oxidoreductase, partial [Dietzia sp.]|nr:FAD-dependent oxidoreductase [Dietzia sp.]